MKSFAAPILAVLSLCVLQAAAPRASMAQWPDGHFDYEPHTTTHFDYVPHNGHYDLVPHTTTHYDPVWHPTNGVYWNDNVVTYPSSTVTYPSSTVNYAPTAAGASIVTNSIPAPNVVPSAAPADGTITLTNPADNGGAVNYKVNAFSYTAKPGETQTLTNDRAWTIAFDSGRGRQVNQRLEKGSYRFQVDPANGWTLSRIDAGTAGDAPAPPR